MTVAVAISTVKPDTAVLRLSCSQCPVTEVRTQPMDTSRTRRAARLILRRDAAHAAVTAARKSGWTLENAHSAHLCPTCSKGQPMPQLIAAPSRELAVA